MKMTISTGTQLQDMFRAYDRDYYTPEGYDALLEYYDEVDPDMELDVVAICGDCTEYGDSATCSLSDMIADYGYLINDNVADDMPREDYISDLVDALNDHTTVLELSNGNYIVFVF